MSQVKSLKSRQRRGSPKAAKVKSFGIIALPVVLLTSGLIVEIVIVAMTTSFFLVNSEMGIRLSADAFFMARSGTQDALLRIVRDKTFSSSGYNLAVDNGSARIEVCKDAPCTAVGKDKINVIGISPLQSQFRELETILTVDSTTGETKLESSSEATLSLSASDVPTGLAATKNWPNVNLSWVAPSGGDITPVTNYKIYRGTISGGETYLNMVGNQLTYTDSSPNLPSSYYKVSAVNAIGESSLSSEASAIFNVPSAPQNLAAVKNWPNTNLTWTAPADNGGAPITNYKIYRGASSGNETYYATVGAVLLYTDSAPNPSANYYKVLAVNAIGDGILGNEASAIFSVPSAPQNLTASSGNERVILNWQTPSSSGDSAIINYKIYRGTASGGETLLTTVGVVLTYIDTGLTNGTTYYYKVSAVNGSGEGAQSNEVSAVPASRVFITSTLYTGNLGGLSGADAKCQTRADAASLGGTWKAWLSDNNTSASSRLVHSTGPYKLVTGTTIANNWTDLTDGSIIAAIDKDEFSGTTRAYVWTNTDVNGILSSQACNNWTSSASYDYGIIGSARFINNYWTMITTYSCNITGLGLYCFEQ